MVLIHCHATAAGAAGAAGSRFLATLQWLAHGADAEMVVMVCYCSVNEEAAAMEAAGANDARRW